ncbi:MAG: rod shape-determining protein MreD [Candidatus Nanopelagicaceae bacterium]
MRIPYILITLLGVFIFQEALLNRVNFLIGGFSIYLVFVIAWTLQGEPSNAMLIGFFAGFIADFSPTLESPFGLWTLILTGFCYFLATTVRGNLDPQISPLQMTLVTATSSAVLLILFISIGAILGQELSSISILLSEIIGNALWSLILAPIYIPMTIKFHKLSLTARER